ncbi:MAG: transposase [Candidatus Eisenbacteria bacterium]|nr:transposase [Candidatus Eisenbacteria bacterium]
MIKNELAAGVVPRQRFGANPAWSRGNLIAYNYPSLLKCHALPERLRDAKPKPLRYEIFSIAASIREHARKLTARLGAPPLTGRRIGFRSPEALTVGRAMEGDIRRGLSRAASLLERGFSARHSCVFAIGS